MDIRQSILDSLAPLAFAREYAASHPEPVRPARSDGCPVCGAFPEIGTQWGEPSRSYRAWVSETARCNSPWHNQHA